MRSRNEVLAKLDDLRSRRLAQRRAKFLERSHLNCLSNIKLRVKGHGKCGFCRQPEVVKKAKGAPFVCDEEGTSLRCPFYQCRNTPESVERDFIEIIKTPSRCGNEYPKLAMLIWFLQENATRSRLARLKCAIVDVWFSISKLVMGRWW